MNKLVGILTAFILCLLTFPVSYTVAEDTLPTDYDAIIGTYERVIDRYKTQINTLEAENASLKSINKLLIEEIDDFINFVDEHWADVNRDGYVNAVDASQILAYYVYLSTTDENPVSFFEFINKEIIPVASSIEWTKD